MDAARLWLLGDFIGTNKVLFQIPVYQRNYDWSEANCNRLLKDIEVMLETGEKHFLGAIVYMADKHQGFSLKDYVIIDGQQRLTTTMILLKALADIAEPISADCAADIVESYLQNQRCSEEQKIKLKPVKTDNMQYQALMQSAYDELDGEGHIGRNYDLFRKRLSNWIDKGITPEEILEALQKLEIVGILLEKGVDDPQIIFESINSTGLELSNADLIRNFLLMNANEQDSLYENYWLRIEKDLKQGTDYSNLNMFFTHYFVFKTGSPVNSERIYEKFVRFFMDRQYTHQGILDELRKYASIYSSFVYEKPDMYSEQVRRALRSLRQLKQTTCYPFLLHVFDDFDQGIIDLVTLEKVLSFLVAYLLRRMVCGVQSNTLRGLFTYLYSRVFKVEENKQKYYESINKFLHTVTSKDLVPSDREFDRALSSMNIYGNQALAKFLLMDIENGNAKETLSIDTLTIEHIMPQTQSAQWKHIPEAEYELYLHVLGNLSVTGYNSELSNKSFDEKKRIIAEHSKAVVLNADVLSEDVWTIESIKRRGKRLGKIVRDRYAIEHINDPSIEFEYLAAISLDDYTQVTGKKLVSFSLDGEVFRQNVYWAMLVDVVKLLDQKHPGILQALAVNEFYLGNGRKHPIVSSSPDRMRNAHLVQDGVYIELHFSAYRIMQVIDAVFEQFQHPKESFAISVIAEEDEDVEEA